MANSIYDLKHKAMAAERVLAMPDNEIVHAYPHIAEMIGPDLRYADIICVLRAKHRATVDRYACTQTAIWLMTLPTGSIGYLDGLLSGSDRLSVNSARQIVRIARELKTMHSSIRFLLTCEIDSIWRRRRPMISVLQRNCDSKAPILIGAIWIFALLFQAEPWRRPTISSSMSSKTRFQSTPRPGAPIISDIVEWRLTDLEGGDAGNGN